MILHSQQSGNSQAAEELAGLCDLIGVEAREVDPITATELWQKNDIRGLVKLMHDRAIEAQQKAIGELDALRDENFHLRHNPKGCSFCGALQGHTAECWTVETVNRLSASEARAAQLEAALRSLVEWDKKYPRNSYRIVEYGAVQQSEKELDAICTAAEAALSAPVAQESHAITERDSAEAYAECSDEGVNLLSIIENADYEEGCAAVFELRKIASNLDIYIEHAIEENAERIAAQKEKK
jgi:hypothetical protein